MSMPLPALSLGHDSIFLDYSTSLPLSAEKTIDLLPKIECLFHLSCDNG